jgi:TPR repeat protein
VGTSYERGQRLFEHLDLVGAAELFAESIANREHDSNKALFPLGFLFCNGYITEDDEKGTEHGIALYEHASRLSGKVQDEIELALGTRYFHGDGVAKDLTKAVGHFQRIANQVHTINSRGRQRQHDWIPIYKPEDMAAKEKEASEVSESLTLLETLPDEDGAFRGANAFFVGNMHDFGGRGQERNHTKACEYYELAASLGDLKGMAAFSQCLQEAGNSTGAFDLLVRSAGEGLSRAQYELGMLFFRGRVSEAELHKRAPAAASSPGAAVGVGAIGGGRMDLAEVGRREAFVFLRAAADQGQQSANFQLGE